MGYPNRDHLLKEIVLFIHENIKKRKKTNLSETKETPSLCTHQFSLQKIESSWPLKKGSVEKNILAWNVYETNTEVINAFIAFCIKSLAVGIKKDHKNFSDELKTMSQSNVNLQKHPLEKIFYNEYIKGFFWDDIKKYYQSHSISFTSRKENRAEAVKRLIPHSSCVVLCVDSSFFRLRSGSNQELSSFEYFIEDLYNANNSLIVFSRQKLIHSNKNGLKVNNYAISFKINKELIKTSIFEALEPQAHLIQSSRFIEANKTGCFDRLIDLLSAGQNYVQAIENEFAEWKETNHSL